MLRNRIKAQSLYEFTDASTITPLELQNDPSTSRERSTGTQYLCVRCYWLEGVDEMLQATRRRLGATCSDTTFYGMPININFVFEGLKLETRKGIQQGREYYYLVWLNKFNCIEWRIAPKLTHNGSIQAMKLTGHLSKSAWGTPKGVRELLAYIRQHELHNHKPGLEESRS